MRQRKRLIMPKRGPKTGDLVKVHYKDVWYEGVWESDDTVSIIEDFSQSAYGRPKYITSPTRKKDATHTEVPTEDV